MPYINSTTREQLGYPSKPIKLLDRIIKASCLEDGVVLDPFCGCGTTIHSAILNKKQWTGMDNATQFGFHQLQNNKDI